MAGFTLVSMEVLPFDEENDAGWQFQVHVEGQNLVNAARPLLARLGEQVVEAVRIYSEGTGFSGFLQQAPQDGDQLFVNYAGFEEQQTELVFRSGVA